MIHDANGIHLRIGDVVYVPCFVVNLHDTQEYSNVTLETVHGRSPDGNRETITALNTAQVVLYHRPK
jgi:uncharacterized RmlC-like cupin family protein